MAKKLEILRTILPNPGCDRESSISILFQVSRGLQTKQSAGKNGRVNQHYQMDSDKNPLFYNLIDLLMA